MRSDIKVGIIGAMEVEVAHLVASLEGESVSTVAGMEFHAGTLGGVPVVVVRSGVGKVNAGVCVQVLVDRYGVTHVVNTGVAGSLDARIDVGDIVVSTDCRYHDVDATVFGYEPGEIPQLGCVGFSADAGLRAQAVAAVRDVAGGVRAFEGRVVSGDTFVADAHEKERLARDFGGMCCEMEGAAVAQTAWLNRVPFVVVRAISDKPGSTCVAVAITYESAPPARKTRQRGHLVRICFDYAPSGVIFSPKGAFPSTGRRPYTPWMQIPTISGPVCTRRSAEMPERMTSTALSTWASTRSSSSSNMSHALEQQMATRTLSYLLACSSTREICVSMEHGHAHLVVPSRLLLNEGDLRVDGALPTACLPRDHVGALLVAGDYGFDVERGSQSVHGGTDAAALAQVLKALYREEHRVLACHQLEHRANVLQGDTLLDHAYGLHHYKPRANSDALGVHHNNREVVQLVGKHAHGVAGGREAGGDAHEDCGRVAVVMRAVELASDRCGRGERGRGNLGGHALDELLGRDGDAALERRAVREVYAQWDDAHVVLARERGGRVRARVGDDCDSLAVQRSLQWTSEKESASDYFIATTIAIASSFEY